MKRVTQFRFFSFFFLFSLFFVDRGFAQAQGPGPSPVPVNEPGPSANLYAIVQRAPNSRLWQQGILMTNTEGDVSTNYQSYTELATGICYTNNSTGQLVDSVEQVESVAGGAQAMQGQYGVQWGLDDGTPITIHTPEGRQLTCQVYGLAYYDLSTGSNAPISRVQESQGQVAPPNQVIYSQSFSNINADILYTYTFAGLSQDIVFHQAPPAPDTFGLSDSNTVLQVYTQWFNTPDPVATSVTNGNVLDDQVLNFGAMQMNVGNSLFFDGNGDPLTISPVRKQWVHVNGSTYLVESVPWSAISNQVAQLPTASNLKPGRAVRGLAWLDHQGNKGNGDKLLHGAPGQRTMKTAKADLDGKRFSIDFEMTLSSGSTVTLQGDTTYYVGSVVNVSSKLVIEGGTVVKYTNGGAINVTGGGSNIVCLTSPYRMAVFTSMNDDSVGTIISGSTGSPSQASTYISFSMQSTQSMTLSYLRFCYASTAVSSTVSTNGSGAPWIKFLDCQFYDCGTAISCDSDANLMPIYVYNVLFSDVTYGIVAEGSNTDLTVSAENVTADNMHYFTLSVSSGNVTATNCIFTAVTNPPGTSSRTDCCVNSSSSGVYQITGAGGYYLNTTNGTVGSTNRGAGTTAIDAGLLADLGTLTTYPPGVIQGTITANTALATNVNVPRNTGIPDIGYHYPPLDWAINASVSATITVQPGTALCTYGSSNGIGLNSGGVIQSTGTANSPIYMVRYNTVQEQSNTNWETTNTWLGSVVVGGAATGASANFVFTEWSVLASDYQFYSSDDPGGTAGPTLALRNCQLYGGQVYDLGGVILSTNSLYWRVDLQFQDAAGTVSDSFCNNLFWNGLLNVYHDNTGNWTFRDNLFDRVPITLNSGASVNVCYNNAYVTTTNGYFSPTNGAVFLTASPAYQTGTLGQFYYPSTLTSLIFQGSQSASVAGLNYYTVTPDNTADGTNKVSIGFHYLPFAIGPVITSEPVSVTNTPGGSATFSVTATGVAPLTYQWYQNGVALSGHTSSALMLTGVTASQAGSYEVVVTDPDGTTVSSIAVLKEAQNDFYVNYWNTGAISPINSMVRGIVDSAVYYPPTASVMLQTMTNASVRGIAPGTDADTYNWEKLTSFGNRVFTNNYFLGNSNNATTPTTLQLMQDASTNGETLIFTVNSRGEGYVSGTNWIQYTQTNADLATLASNWVRYCNFIVRHYCWSNSIMTPMNGQTSIIATDSNIIMNLVSNWVAGTGTATNPLPTLLTYADWHVLQPVKYWEIGNEVETAMPANIYLNGTIFSATTYKTTYEAIVSAMTNAVTNVPIQVGPGFAGETTNNALIDYLLSNTIAPVNFIVHHPYPADGQLLNGYFTSNNVADLAGTLESIKHWQNDVTSWDMTQQFVTNGLAVDVPIFATEWSGDYAQEIAANDPIPWSMWTMLADAETLLSIVKGQQTMAACLYEPIPLSFTNNSNLCYGADWPANFMRFQTNLGNVFLSSSDGDNIPAQFGVPGDGNTNWMQGSMESPFRAYSTMDTNSGSMSVWLLNLTNSVSQTVDLHFPASIFNAVLWTLGNTNMAPNLTNTNYFGGTNFVWLSNVVTWANGNSVVLTNSPATLMVVQVGLSNVPPSVAAPVISSMPGMGQPGQVITITGNNFSANLLQNTVYFGPVRGTVTSASKTLLTVQVPFGSAYGPVTVTVSNLTAYSTNFFNPAYYGASTANPISFQAVRTNVFTNTMSSASFGYASEMTFFDADGDGKGDLAFVGRPGVAGIFENTASGAGNFVLSNTPYSLPIGDEPGGTAYGDFDGDGLLDWAVVQANDRAMEIFRNESTPGNIFFGEGNMYVTGRSPVDVKVMDFDGDGRPDIVVANQEDNSISVYRNLSTGPGSITFAQKVDFPACPNAQYLAVGDFDGDGKPDIAVTGQSGTGGVSNVVVLRNLSTPGNILFDSPVMVANLNVPWGIVAGDFNGDGKLDLAVSEFGSLIGNLHVYTNNSTVGNVSFASTPVVTGLSAPEGVAIGDLNGDGLLDIAIANSGNSTISVFQNHGNGSFISSTNVMTGSGAAATLVILADTDGDGRIDMSAANFFTPNVVVFQNTSQY